MLDSTGLGNSVSNLAGPKGGGVLGDSFPKGGYFLNRLPAMNPPWEPYHPGPFPQEETTLPWNPYAPPRALGGMHQTVVDPSVSDSSSRSGEAQKVNDGEKSEEDTELTFHPSETDADFLSAPQVESKFHSEVTKLLSESFAKPLSNKARVSLEKHSPTPSSLRPLHLDTLMRLLAGK